MEEPVPPRFHLPQLDPYDGTADPLDHLESYKVLMQVQRVTYSLLYVTFPATLRKAARAWYFRLPPRSINSFRQLERSFLAHFDTCRKIPWVADSLFAVQQRSGETLKDFVARFKEAALEVYNLEDSVATLALKRGLRPSRFAYSLDKKPPSSYAELLSRAQKYICADEADSSRRKVDKRSGKKPAPSEPARVRSRKPEPPRRSDNRSQTLVPKEHFTPLLALISHILLEIEDEPYLRCPPPMRPGVPRSKELYYRYHRDYGHDTDDCRLLKKAIEELVQQGHLGKFIQRGNPAAPSPSAPPAPQIGVDNAPTEKTMAMISWGQVTILKDSMRRE